MAGPALTDTVANYDRSTARRHRSPAASRIAEGFPIPNCARNCCPRRRRWTLPFRLPGPTTNRPFPWKTYWAATLLAARSPRQSGEVRTVPRRKPKNVPSKWVWIGIGRRCSGLILSSSMPPSRRVRTKHRRRDHGVCRKYRSERTSASPIRSVRFHSSGNRIILFLRRAPNSTRARSP